MNRYVSATASLLCAITAILPTAALGQLSPRERTKAQEVARIQAEADAKEREKTQRIRRDMAKAVCSSSRRVWDYANDTCKPR